MGQFSIRTLFWATTVLAVFLTSWVYVSNFFFSLALTFVVLAAIRLTVLACWYLWSIRK